MNKLITAALLLTLSAAQVQAQSTRSFTETSVTEGGSSVTGTAKPTVKVVYRSAEGLAGCEMQIREGLVSFSQLPAHGRMRVYVTNESGDVVLDQRLSARNNSISINRLKTGLHFVTLVNEVDRSRRAFTLAR